MVFSAPFWFISFATPCEPLPGLPISSLMVVVPGIVAYAFVARTDGRQGAALWLKRGWTLPGLKRSHWLAVAAFVPPGMMFAAYLGMKAVGYELPEPAISFSGVITLLALFIVPAIFEELGWSCFALVALQQRMSALNASLLIGSTWAVWHIIPLLQAGREIDWMLPCFTHPRT
jgi:membrane protease YdiL (CAAX protease family)